MTVLSACVALLLAACEPPTEPIAAEDRYLVHAVLDLGAQRQVIIVERTQNQTPFGFGDRGVRSATVTVTAPDGRIMTAVEDTTVFQMPIYMPHGVYRLDAAYPAELTPAATYTLRIRTVQGDSVVGHTTIPNVQPPQGATTVNFRGATDTVRMTWSRVPGARSYQVAVSGRADLQATGTFLYSVFADTTITIAGTARSFDDDPLFVPGRTTSVVVAAVDDNYFTYYHDAVDPFAGAPPSRLTGAIGVFGSIVPVIIRSYVVR